MKPQTVGIAGDVLKITEFEMRYSKLLKNGTLH